MEINFFFQGLLLGFAIAAPVGPIGILCIRRTLQFGRLSGLVSGLGAAVADTLYGLTAALGLTFISDFLFDNQQCLRLVGGAFLIYLGWKTYHSKPAEEFKEVTHNTLLSDFMSTLFLTLTNPLTLVSYLAIFAGLGIADLKGNYVNAVYLIVGIFLGSAMWWFLLSEVITIFRERISLHLMTWINKVAGILIAGFGVAAWISMRWG